MKQEVYEFLRTIPKGKVVTYKTIAEALGRPKAARAIGNILHNNEDPIYYPCYKVVDRNGRLAEHFGDEGGIKTQKKRLEADGIEVKDYRVDLKRYLWK